MPLGGPWEPFLAQEFDAWANTAIPTTTSRSTVHESTSNDYNDNQNVTPNKISTTTNTAATLLPSHIPQRTSSTTTNIAFIFGLFLIVLQCFIQVGNAVVTQYLFEQMEMESPILMTYLGISMLTLCLPLEWYWSRKKYNEQHDNNDDNNTISSFDSLADDMRKLQTAPSFGSSYHVCFMDIATRRANDLVTNHVRHWNHRKHIMAACLLTPAMFLSDWLFNASLQNTSVSSSTVLVSIQSVFVFMIASVMKLESSSVMKLGGVLCGIIGTVLTAIHDETNADENDPDCYTEEDTVIVGDSVGTTTKGDILAIAAAVMYATYTIQVRLYCPSNEDLYSLPLLLGYIGLISMIVTLPIVGLTTTTETFANLTFGTVSVMLIKGVFDFLISDYLMFRSIVLTSPTIATVGLGLSIPMAFGADLLLRFTETYDDFVLDWLSCLGAVTCLIGFLLVNLDSDNGDDDGKEDIVNEDDGVTQNGILASNGVDYIEATTDFQKLEERRYDRDDHRVIL